MSRKKINHWPLFCVLSAYGIAIFILVLQVLSKTNHELIYTLDDAYIHMAVAKNFSQHGVWGITPYEFSSTSSSILWTLLLSIYFLLFGVNTLAPFILNVLFSIGVIGFSYFVLKRNAVSPISTFIILLIIAFVTPLPALTLTGMEHILHVLLAMVFAYSAACALANSESQEGKRMTLAMLITAPLLSLERYEGLAAIAIVFFFLLLRRQEILAFLLGTLAAIPVIVFGLISIDLGGWFLPNTALKAGTPSLTRILFYSGHETLILYSFVIMGLVFYIHRSRHFSFWNKWQLLLAISVGMILLHLTLARQGWFYRYEAYMIGFNLLIFGYVALEWLTSFSMEHEHARSTVIATCILTAFVALPLAERAIRSFKDVAGASESIYLQQVQMSRFVKQFYPTDWVACNDIGAVCFYNDQIHCLDLTGLGSIEIARSALDPDLNAEKKLKLFESMITKYQIPLIMIYEPWFKESIPATWIKGGQWTVATSATLDDPTVSFFTSSPHLLKKLVTSLQQFSIETASLNIKEEIYPY